MRLKCGSAHSTRSRRLSKPSTFRLYIYLTIDPLKGGGYLGVVNLGGINDRIQNFIYSRCHPPQLSTRASEYLSYLTSSGV